MTTKKYHSTVDFSTSCHGKRVRFSRCYTVNGLLHHGTYETSDIDEQKAIEASAFFGTYIFIDAVCNEEGPAVEAEAETPINTVTVVESVTTEDEAAEFFVKEFGLEASKVSSMTKIRNRMKEYNVEFPNLSK